VTPEQKSRRLAIGLLLGAAVALVAVVAIPFYLLNRHYDTALADLGGLLNRYKRIAGSRAEATRQLETMRAVETRRAFLRSGAGGR
jgi:hypothetical protein